MPKFKKNTDYSMKGSEFYGHGNSSPAKVSDEDVIAAQGRLDQIELGYRTPGWAKAAGQIFSGSGQLGGLMGGKGKGKGKDKGKGGGSKGGGSKGGGLSNAKLDHGLGDDSQLFDDSLQNLDFGSTI